MLHCARVIAIVPVFDHRVKELSKHLRGEIRHSVLIIVGMKTQTVAADFNPNLIALFISSYHPHSLDERMSRVVHSSLDALVQGPVVGGCLVPQADVNCWGEGSCHTVVVPPQIRKVCTIENYQHGVWTNKFHD